jgi:hypothetical protein
MTETFANTSVFMRKCLGDKLEKLEVGVSALDPGLYEPDFHKFIVLTPEQREIEVDLLEAPEIADKVVSTLLDKDCIDTRAFISKKLWNVYSDFDDNFKAKEPEYFKHII